MTLTYIITEEVHKQISEYMYYNNEDNGIKHVICFQDFTKLILLNLIF